MSLLKLQGITKSFSGVRVLDDVDLEVHPGEVHALAGENGAGKSTLMNIVSGLIPADSGRMLWEDRPVRLRSPRDAIDLGISFVHQELALVPQLTAAENVLPRCDGCVGARFTIGRAHCSPNWAIPWILTGRSEN